MRYDSLYGKLLDECEKGLAEMQTKFGTKAKPPSDAAGSTDGTTVR
jgi:hypothetical protein